MQNLEHAGLPEREEKNGLYRHKLVKRTEGSQAFLCRLVKEDQKVKRKRHRDVIYEGQPWKSTVQVVGAVAEHSILVEQDRKDGSDWLYEDELQDALFYSTVENSSSQNRKKYKRFNGTSKTMNVKAKS